MGHLKEAPTFTALVTAETAKKVSEMARRNFVSEPVMAALLAELGSMAISSEACASAIGGSTGGLLRKALEDGSSSGQIEVSDDGGGSDYIVAADIYRRSLEEWLGVLVHLGIAASGCPAVVDARIHSIGSLCALAQCKSDSIRKHHADFKPAPAAFFKFERVLAAEHGKGGVKP